jgi:hypothetical protein
MSAFPQDKPDDQKKHDIGAIGSSWLARAK